MNDQEKEMHRKLRLALWESGWLPVKSENKDIAFDSFDHSVYQKDFLSTRYTSTVFAVLPHELHINGHFGIAWCECYYEYQDRALSMKLAINLAEKNLLLCEIPFCDNKDFHGTKQEIRWKINRNNKIRKKWNLDEIEKSLGWGGDD